MHDKLKDRTKESYKTRDSGGGLKNYFDNEKIGDTPTWWAGKGDHIIDIIPYFAGAHDPHNKEGEPAYVLNLEVHRYVGPMDAMIVCPAQYNLPCPICEEGRKLNSEKADYKTVVKPLKPSRRVVYNVIVRDGGDMEKKGVQIFEIAHWFMEKHLAKIAKDPRGGGYTVFSDPDDGRSISFERTGTGSENTGYSGHRFVDRPEIITDDELAEAICLDDIIELKDYEEIYELFHGKNADAKEEEEEEYEVDNDAMVDEAYESEEPEEEAEEKPPKRKKREKKSRKQRAPKCPHGHVIGEDVDEYEDCEDCVMYDQCNDIADEM